MPAPEAKASSTLKWRVAILQQLAVAAGCCFWRGARGRTRGREGGCPCLAGVGCMHPLPTHRGCPSCPCTGCLCGRERRGLLLACKRSLGWCCCRMPYYMILGPRRSKKAQKAATGVLRSINPLARLQVLQCMVLLQRVRSSVCTGVPISSCTKHMAWFWMCHVGFHVMPVRAAGAGVCACSASAAGAGLRAAMRRCAAGEGSTGGGSWRGAAGASSFYRK